MRNFKKFLALVLAMLMVSACAVSVSAFNDQDKIDASGYAEAIEMLSKLGVVKGDEKGNYNPSNTLRRDEAATIIAKLVAGVTPIEWTAETTKFADVTAKWSFAYINYVADRKIMEGDGTGFKPTRTLQIDEALALALKAASPSTVREVEIKNAQFPTNHWADYYISAADELGLTDGLGTIYDYEAACSKAMFAKIAVNMLNYSITEGEGPNAITIHPIGDGFGYASETAKITAVDTTNGTVTLTSLVAGRTIPTIKLDAFNAALKEAGVEKTAAELVNYKVTMQWSTKTYAIYDVEVLTKVDTYTYATEALKYVPTAADANVAEAGKIELNGKVYDIASDDTAAGQITQIGGSAAADTNNIRIYNNPIKTAPLNEITTVVKGTTIPAYYTVDCYDDNGDGDYERAYITTYKLVTFTKSDNKVDHDHNATTDPLNATVVKEFAADGSEATKYIRDDRYLTVAGAGYTAWGETPVLANIIVVDTENISAKILETAEKVTGVASNIKADTYIVIDGKTINFAAGYADPANWTLSQNVTVYTIGGKYVAVASADTGVESGKVTKNVLVDNVTIVNDAAVVTGYEYANGTLTPITLTVNGAVVGTGANGKLISMKAYRDTATADYNLVDGITEADNAYALVYLANKDADGNLTTSKYLLEDKTFYNFEVTSAGTYFAGASGTVLPDHFATETVEVKIDGAYIRVGTTATFKLESTYVVITNKNADTSKAYTAYSNDIKVDANGAIPANNGVTYAARQKNFAFASDTVNDKVAFVYVTAVTPKPLTDKTIKSLAEEGVTTIARVYAEESVALDYTAYKAVDVFTGAEIDIIAKSGKEVSVGAYVNVNAANEIMGVSKWMNNFNISVTTELGVVTKVTAQNTYLKSVYTGTVGGVAQYNPYVLTPDSADSATVTFGLDNVTVWKIENGKLKAVTDHSYAGAATQTRFGFVNGGKVVIITNP